MSDLVGGATPSMFGLRWINATSLRWHSTPACRVLRATRTQAGWTPFPITLGYGADFYTPCSQCAASTPTRGSDR